MSVDASFTITFLKETLNISKQYFYSTVQSGSTLQRQFVTTI